MTSKFSRVSIFQPSIHLTETLNQMTRVAITAVLANITCCQSTPQSLQVFGLRDYFMRAFGWEVYIVAKKQEVPRTVPFLLTIKTLTF
jgi:hypothetical protein